MARGEALLRVSAVELDLTSSDRRNGAHAFYAASASPTSRGRFVKAISPPDR